MAVCNELPHLLQNRRVGGLPSPQSPQIRSSGCSRRVGGAVTTGATGRRGRNGWGGSGSGWGLRSAGPGGVRMLGAGRSCRFGSASGSGGIGATNAAASGRAGASRSGTGRSGTGRSGVGGSGVDCGSGSATAGFADAGSSFSPVHSR